MKIDCLMGTYGRHSLASEALACFLQQTALPQASLLIYNQHSVPLKFDHPQVRVINETPPLGSLRYIKKRMCELADPSAEFIHWWEDDDLYLPWHLEDCLSHIGQSVAWQPEASWMSERNVNFSLHSNRFEGSWIFRADYIMSAPIDTHPTYTDHPVFMQTEERKLLRATNLGGRTSYIYRWDTGTEHISAYGGTGDEMRQRHNLQSLRRLSNDVRCDGKFVPSDLSVRWRQYLLGTKEHISSADWELNRSRLNVACDLRGWP